MKKIICIVITTVMFVFANTAFAEISGIMLSKQEVVNSIMEVNPVAAPKDIEACYNAMKNDGFHRISSSKVTIYCTKNELMRVFAQ